DPHRTFSLQRVAGFSPERIRQHIAPGDGVSLRMPGDADVAETITLQQAAVEHVEGAGERSGGPCAIAGNQQEGSDALVLEPSEMRGQFLAAAKRAGRYVRHRPESEPLQLAAGGDAIAHVSAGQE